MKKYSTDTKTIVSFFSLIALSLLGLSLMEPRSQYWVGANAIWSGTMFVAALLSTRGSYVVIDDGLLKFVYLFFYRRRMRIDAITEISDQPTYKIASSAFRSLYIFYNRDDGMQKYIELRLGVFPKDAITGLIRTLKEENPKIILSGVCEKLIKTG